MHCSEEVQRRDRNLLINYNENEQSRMDADCPLQIGFADCISGALFFTLYTKKSANPSLGGAQ